MPLLCVDRCSRAWRANSKSPRECSPPFPTVSAPIALTRRAGAPGNSHLVSCDVQMTDEIADQKFQMEPRFKEEPKNVRKLVDWYDKNFNRAMNRVHAMTPDSSTRRWIFSLSTSRPCSTSASSTTTAFTIAASSRSICARWAPRSRLSPAGAPMNPGRARPNSALAVPRAQSWRPASSCNPRVGKPDLLLPAYSLFALRLRASLLLGNRPARSRNVSAASPSSPLSAKRELLISSQLLELAFRAFLNGSPASLVVGGI